MTDGAVQPAARVADRAALRSLSRRRWWVWGNIVLFVLVMAVMVVLSMTQRDSQSVESCHKRLTYTRNALQDALARGEIAPSSLPLPSPPPVPEDASVAELEQQQEAKLVLRDHYFYHSHYAQRGGVERRVGVCCCKAPHHLYLRDDGRHVILFDGQRYELRWMTEAEFRRQVSALGLKVPEAP